MWTCPSCKITGGETVFYTRVNKKGKLESSGKCRKCHKEYVRTRQKQDPKKHRKYCRTWELKVKYGLTWDEFRSHYDLQRGVCLICKNAFELEELNVDHCHKSGKVRGLLCNSCNWGLGHFKDDSLLLAAAIAYLGETR